MKLFKYGVYALCASAMLSISSCFNLDEEPYSEIIEEDYVPTEADEIALLATTYSQLRFVMDWYGLFDLQEESGDVFERCLTGDPKLLCTAKVLAYVRRSPDKGRLQISDLRRTEQKV